MSMLKCTYHSTQHFNGGLPESAKLRRRFMAQWVDRWLRLVFCRLGQSTCVCHQSGPARGILYQGITHFSYFPLSSCATFELVHRYDIISTMHRSSRW